MHLLTNRLIVRYLMLLCATFGLFLILVFTIQTYAKTLEARINVTEMDFLQRLAQVKEVHSLLQKIEVSFHSVATSPIASPESRRQIVLQVEGHITNILMLHGLLSEAQCLQGLAARDSFLAALPEQLFRIEPLLQQLAETVDLRDRLLIEEDQNLLLPVARRVRLITMQISPLFEEMYTLVTTLVDVSEQELLSLSQTNQITKQRYFFIELGVIISCVALFVLFSVIIFRQLLALYRRLENQLKTDSLTSLANRFALVEQLPTCVTPLIGIFDIDNFRVVNELYGAQAGNEFLVQLAKELTKLGLRQQLGVFRTSGDEFVLLGCTSKCSTDHFIDHMVEVVEKTNQRYFTLACIDEKVKVSLTCGVCTEGEQGLEKAGKALKRAKEKRQALAIYDESVDKSDEQETLRWIERIGEGLKEDAFVPLFQPIVDARGYPVKFEALMRLRATDSHGAVEYVPPVHFLELSHKSKTYHQLSRMMLVKSLKIAKEKKIHISINLNYQDYINDALIEDLLQMIKILDIGSQLTFEIVETEDVKNYDLVREFMDMFRAFGVKFSIDDFGAGFSNFHSISILRPDYIKIDGSLIKNLDSDFLSWTLVKSICILARELNIKTIAEYVHSEPVFVKARELGVDLFQGYYFSKPVAAIAPPDIPLVATTTPPLVD